MAPEDCAFGTYSGYAVQPVSVAFALPYNASQAARQPSEAPVGAACLPCPDGYACGEPALPPALCPGGTAAGEGGATYRLNNDTGVDADSGGGGATENGAPVPAATDVSRRGDPDYCVPCPSGSSCAVPNAMPVRRCFA